MPEDWLENIDMAAPLLRSNVAGCSCRRGKVRDVYAVTEDRLLIVATDRISAFDCILPTPIERKGEVLTALSRFWTSTRWLTAICC